MDLKKLKKHSLLLLIVAVAFGVRLYQITNPLADWHSWRQADTASVTREYVKQGIDLLRPKYHDLSNIPSGKENPIGYRMVEFPIVNAALAWLIKTFNLPLVVTSRLASVLVSLGTLLSLYFLVKKLSGEKIALLTALVFAVLPYSIYYSRVILPEPYMLFFSTLSLTTFYYWLKEKKLYFYLLSVVALTFALLFKPFTLFLAPVYAIMALQEFGLKAVFQPLLYLYALLPLAPFYWWREWIAKYPEGIPASSWLFNSNGIRLRPAWFRWLFWERLSILFLGYVGILALPANFLKRGKDFWVYGAWWVGILAYFVIIATGNVQHDYYQNLAIPIIVISVARGSYLVYELLLKQKKLASFAPFVLSGFLMLTFFLAWQQVRGYFSINHWEYVEAGEYVDKNLPADAIVIAPAFGDTQFLFQTNRRGWPIGGMIPEKIAQGAQYYVTTAMDEEAKELSFKYSVIKYDPKFIVIDLTQPTATDSATPKP